MMVARHRPNDPLSSLRRNPRFMNTQNLSKPAAVAKYSYFTNPFQEPMAASSRDVLPDLQPLTKPLIETEPSYNTGRIDRAFSEDELTLASMTSWTNSRASSSSSAGDNSPEHIIHLSSIEHCMPRAYIRVCLAYAVPDMTKLPAAVLKLNDFVRRTVDAKPYLAGYVTISKNPGRHVGEVEVRFTTKDFYNYPDVVVKKLKDRDGNPVRYRDLDEQALPPSCLKPEDVSLLPADVADDDRAPVLRVQANVVENGMIVSFYLHHCISDGQGLGLLVSGNVLDDDFTFQRHPGPQIQSLLSLESRLHEFAKQKSAVRGTLSWSDPKQPQTRVLQHKIIGEEPPPNNKPGRGCVMLMPRQSLIHLLAKLSTLQARSKLTLHSVLMALLWRHMTRARRPSISSEANAKTSKLLIPVDIRRKMKENLSDSYFGAAVDFAQAELDLDLLVQNDDHSLGGIAKTIRTATEAVDESYVRQAIALAQSRDSRIDVRDLQASNMDRVNGADMYITSWLRLPLYDAHLGMELGKPEWVRKPWSKDPGSCIILPCRSPDSELIEVVVQMAETDMTRLLADHTFMEYVSRVID